MSKVLIKSQNEGRDAINPLTAAMNYHDDINIVLFHLWDPNNQVHISVAFLLILIAKLLIFLRWFPTHDVLVSTARCRL